MVPLQNNGPRRSQETIRFVAQEYGWWCAHVPYKLHYLKVSFSCLVSSVSLRDLEGDVLESLFLLYCYTALFPYRRVGNINLCDTIYIRH